MINEKDNYHTKSFLGAQKDYEMICKDNKIVIPSSLKEKVLEWYQTNLIHPGKDRTYATIAQHFYWKGMKMTYNNLSQSSQHVKRLRTENKSMDIFQPRKLKSLHGTNYV